MISFKELGNFGRTGNQLFQIACTIALALDNNDQYCFPQWKYEPYFNLHGCFSNNINAIKTYSEPHFHYAAIPYQPNLDLSGYFQSYYYFQHHEQFIKKTLTPVHIIEPQLNITSIHVRRTDYLKFSDYHNVSDMNYYEQAMALCPSEKYYVFSDDIRWCRENFKGNKFEFMEGNHETYDLGLMAKCSNNIIAASSFSWWAAYLNNNPNKIVVAPKKWFGSACNNNTKDLIPKEWSQI